MSDHRDYFKYLTTRSKMGSLYRYYWLYPMLTKKLQGRTLDVGCGIGDMLAYRPKTIGVDINPLTVDFCKKMGLDAVLMQPDILPFEDKEFDSVLLDNVLEHLSDPRLLLNEIHRVLVTGGVLLVGVPGERGYMSDADHKKYYDLASLDLSLSSAGFIRKSAAFYSPFLKSKWLSQKLKQYCLYAQFIAE